MNCYAANCWHAVKM